MTAKTRRSRSSSPKSRRRLKLADLLRPVTPPKGAIADFRRAVAGAQKLARQADEGSEATLREIFATIEQVVASDATRASVQRALRQMSRDLRDLMSARENAAYQIGRAIGNAQR